MRYCKSCVLPDTRPGLIIGSDGICSACAAHAEKFSHIDWDTRKKNFQQLVASIKQKGAHYDCVIPVSGGKDSTWQVLTCLEYGMHPLAVSWKPPSRTPIGMQNLTNLIHLGVDHIDVQINPETEKRFLYKALLRYGSTAIPMHMAMFSIPLIIAVRFNIPLVVWGENSADEYAGVGNESRGHEMDVRWLKQFGVTHGTTAHDWIDDELTEKAMALYLGPGAAEWERHPIRAVFLGYYFKWDPEVSFRMAAEHGFQARPEGPKTGYYDYADIDDDFISIHHYLKWYKFGFTRLYDHLSLEIRNCRMKREEAIRVIRQRADETPLDDIEKFCRFVGISAVHFFEVIEPFRNRAVWIHRNGRWMIENFLIPDWNWEYQNQILAKVGLRALPSGHVKSVEATLAMRP